MKRVWWQAGITFMTVAVVMALAGASNSADSTKAPVSGPGGDTQAGAAAAPPALLTQGALSSDERREIELNVARTQPVTITAAVQELAGGLDRENVHAQIKSVLNEIVRQRVDFSWGDYRPVPVVVLYGNPERERRMAVGVTLPPGGVANLARPLRLERFRSNAVRHIHQGPHEELGAVYREITDALSKYGGTRRQVRRESWPVVLQILDDPTRFDRQQIRTVLNVPVR